MPNGIGDCKSYLDYLDKEMTSLGILSTFCVGFASLALDRIVGNADKITFFKTLWERHIDAILVASFILLVAAWMFYQQRSDLGYYYGGIAMSIAKPSPPEEWTLDDWLVEVDSWNTWIFYRLGMTTLITGFLVYGQAVYLAIYANAPSRYWIAETAIGVLVMRLVFIVPALSIYRYTPHPYKACWNGIKKGSILDDWQSRGQRPVESKLQPRVEVSSETIPRAE